MSEIVSNGVSGMRTREVVWSEWYANSYRVVITQETPSEVKIAVHIVGGKVVFEKTVSLPFLSSIFGITDADIARWRAECLDQIAQMRREYKKPLAREHPQFSQLFNEPIDAEPMPAHQTPHQVWLDEVGDVQQEVFFDEDIDEEEEEEGFFYEDEVTLY